MVPVKCTHRAIRHGAMRLPGRGTEQLIADSWLPTRKTTGRFARFFRSEAQLHEHSTVSAQLSGKPGRIGLKFELSMGLLCEAMRRLKMRTRKLIQGKPSVSATSEFLW